MNVRIRKQLSVLWVWGCIFLQAAIDPVSGQDRQTALPIESGSRLVHEFGFHEPDNLDSMPKYWVRFPASEYSDPAFPRYTKARFDFDIGHDAAPSFYLESAGRCVASRYVGPDTRIKPGNYLIVGWIKPDRMKHSRAALSTYYLDWEGRYIASTQRFSRLVGASEDSNDWQWVRIYLPAAPPGAHFIGITCWVVQQDVWRRDMMPHRHISLRDVQGGAWFDDIVVMSLPRAVLESRHPGNVVEYPAVLQLIATVADDDVAGLTSRLTVRDQNGVTVFSQDVAAHSYENEQQVEIDLPVLDPGLYVAKLGVFSVGKPVSQPTLTLAVLGRSHRPRGVVVRQMGVTVTSVSPNQTAEESALIRALGVGAAKLPLWTGDPGNPGFDSHREALHAILDDMIESRIAVIGTLSGPPSSMVRSVGIYARSLLDILSEPFGGWREHLDAMVAPYASIIYSWQVGGDGDIGFIDDARVVPALQAVRQIMQEMIALPNLTTVSTVARQPSATRMPVQNLSVELPDDVRPAFVHDHLKAYRQLGYDRLWVSTSLPQLKSADPWFVLADWALRIVEARWAGVDTIFVPQPWRTRQTLDRAITEPTLPFIVFRTIIDTLSDAKPVARLNMSSTARALAFGDGKRATVVMWDPAALPQGAVHTLQLGAATEAITLWGKAIPLLRSDDGRHEINLSPVPVFITDVEQWLMAFRAGLTLSPDQVDFAVENRRHTLTMTNPQDKPISGEVTFRVPRGWDVGPRRLQFSLHPGETQSFVLNIRHARNETAGMKTVRAIIHFHSGAKYMLDVPLEFELDLRDVDVWGYAVMENDGLAIRHGVTNNADRPLSFRAFAVFPGRSRQYRVINEILPGQSLTLEYRFSDVAGASGRKIRLGLREVNGPRIHNLAVIAP